MSQHEPAADLGHLEAVWEAQAQADPLWAVLSESDKAGRRWDVAAFLATGEEHVAKTLGRFEEVGGQLPDRELAVDFGSGVGRLTQPLARRFERVIGIDISPTMAAVAGRLNEYGDRVEYVVNNRPDLGFIPDRSVSLVSSYITLQHVPPPAAERYLIEFLRIVKPGGGIIFQLPSHFSDSYLPADRDDRPVPPEGRSAGFDAASFDSPMSAGEQVEVVVEVTNRSPVAWTQSAGFPLRLGNHWIDDRSGEIVIHDDGRTRMPGRVRPGETARLAVTVQAPSRPGRYRLRFDVVQEGVAWFGGSDRAGVDIPVEVVAATRAAEADPDPSVQSGYVDTSFDDLISPQPFDAPTFEMNAIPKPQLEELLKFAGATLLGADEWVDEWHSFTYYIQAGDGPVLAPDAFRSMAEISPRPRLEEASEDPTMLDVDGHVISPAELVHRVEELLRSVDGGVLGGGDGPPPEGEAQAWPEIEQPVHDMRSLQWRLSPPELAPPVGMRSRASRLTKQIVRRLTSWYVEPRWVLQQDYDGHNVQFASGVYNQLRHFERELEDLRGRVVTVNRQIMASLERSNRTRADFRTFRTEALESFADKLRTAATQEDFHLMRREVSSLLERLGAASAHGASIDYVGFEDRFRGATDEVRRSQLRYVVAFPGTDIPGRIVDIGCGRGEMLELLIEAGHEVLGVDPDPGMIDFCRSKGLPVVQDDGIHQLERIDDGSLKGIFCAQVVEHLLTAEMEQLIRLAWQKLQPGGMLIVETINPRSLFAVGNHFYADTSHIRPVHPETLRYICEQVGFGLVALEERSPHPAVDLTMGLTRDPLGEAVDVLLRSVFGYQDYAIFASK